MINIFTVNETYFYREEHQLRCLSRSLLPGIIQGRKPGDLVLSILPWPFHKDLPVGPKGPCSTGMICSLSIPIITLCALFLLMIMVALLNFIFFWLPFFLVCFPIPGLKAKSKSPA